MQKKTFYRVGNVKSRQGLWYNLDGEFTGLIHNKYDFCLNSDLPMPYNKEVIGWLSATDKLSDLFNWFPKEDLIKLEKHDFVLGIYEATEYKKHENHWIIKQDSSIYKTHIPVDSL